MRIECILCAGKGWRFKKGGGIELFCCGCEGKGYEEADMNLRLCLLEGFLAVNDLQDEFWSYAIGKVHPTVEDKEKFMKQLEEFPIETLIARAFNWSNTIEGSRFWMKIDKLYRGYLRELKNFLNTPIEPQRFENHKNAF